MSALHDPDVIRRIVDALERRIPRIVAGVVPREQYGTVFGPPDRPARKVAVQLFGQDEPAGDFVYGEVEPRDGDHVRVVIGPHGDRYVEAVLGRTPPAVAEVVDALPAPTDALRGSLVLLEADAAADVLYVCRRAADGSYAWVAVTLA